MAGNPIHTSVPRVFKLLVLAPWLGVFTGLMISVSGPPPIVQFLSPDYWWLIKVGIATLLVYLLTTYYIIPPNMGMGAFAGLVQIGLLVLPIIYLPTAVSSQFSPTAFEKRSLAGSMYGNSDLNESDSKAPDWAVRDSDGMVNLLAISLRPAAYEGKRIVTMGIVHRDESLGEDRFFCYRLLMWCCAADARPIGILVESKTPSSLTSGQWIRVEGTVEKSILKGRQIIMLKGAEVTKVPAPKVPYLFY